MDGFVSEEEIQLLRQIATVGMAGSNDVLAGPVIMDPNSQVVMDSKHGLRRTGAQFEPEQIALYRRLMRRLEEEVGQEFGAKRVHHTVPTFLTRIKGSPTWTPANAHDEYYHPHVDKANTPHYVYSGLVYLADHGADFEGGEFRFLDADGNRTVLPRRGRLSLFTSGRENKHMLERVTSGERLTLSFWFTCDPAMATDTYLGKRAKAGKKFKEVDFGAAGEKEGTDAAGTGGGRSSSAGGGDSPGEGASASRRRRRPRRGPSPQLSPDMGFEEL